MIAEAPKTTKYILSLGLTEVSLGSFLHALHVPFAGHLLSLNQLLILTFATKETSDRVAAAKRTTTISNSVAFIKALSPMGKKLTPMLAISAQGLVYSLGILLFGRGILGLFLGAIFLSLWGVIQPLLLSVLFFGGSVVTAVLALNDQFTHYFNVPTTVGLGILGLLITIKILLSFFVIGVAVSLGDGFEHDYLDYLQTLKIKNGNDKRESHSQAIKALMDLLSPWFLLSLTLTGFYFYYAEHQSAPHLLLRLIRPIGVAWLSFFIARAYLPKLASYLARKGFISNPQEFGHDTNRNF